MRQAGGLKRAVCGVQRDADERKVAMKLAKLVEGRRLQAEMEWESDQGAGEP